MLAHNDLSGGLPDSFKHMLKLEVLDLGFNDFYHEFPQGITSDCC